MSASDELGRMRREEVPSHRRWHLPTVYEMEHNRIESWLRRKAREALAGSRPTLQEALAGADTYAMSVKAVFAVTDENRDALLLEKARLGELEREAPSNAFRISVSIMTAMAACLETGIFVAIYFLDPGNFLVIASGVLLSFGGLISGHGAGSLAGFRDEEGNLIRSGGVLNWIALFGGIIIITGIGILRAGGEEGAASVFAFTTILALCIVILEGIRTTSAAKYKDRVAKEFLCQQWYATERHIKNSSERLWQRLYETEVRRLKKEEVITLSGGEVVDLPATGV